MVDTRFARVKTKRSFFNCNFERGSNVPITNGIMIRAIFILISKKKLLEILSE